MVEQHRPVEENWGPFVEQVHDGPAGIFGPEGLPRTGEMTPRDYDAAVNKIRKGEPNRRDVPQRHPSHITGIR